MLRESDDIKQISDLTPTSTSVDDIRTRADPAAVGITPVSMMIGRRSDVLYEYGKFDNTYCKREIVFLVNVPSYKINK